ncbi:MAG: carboxypeptidase regulatory-like domain-containing protein, partial [Acidimicrobiia bacterium]|nr:carboxypeptidase regulatory-like domain-containing protein [Acidimicrobiia bacterium]
MFALAAQAATTVVNTELGGTFSGTIDTAGVDFVQGQFTAAGGEQVTLTVQAVLGSTLMPTVTIRDMSGTPLSGASRTIGWMGLGNMTHVFTIPSAGFYVAEIGGTSGSGGFTAFLSGTPVVSGTLVDVSGNITDSATSNPIVGATVTVDGGAFATSDSSGDYSGQLDPGSYSFAFMATGYTTQTQAVTVSAGTPINDLDVALVPEIGAGISASASGDMTPGGIVMATVDITVPMGTTINSITWTQTYGSTA